MAPQQEDTPTQGFSQDEFETMLQEQVRWAVRLALEAILQAEVEAFIGALPYERSPARRDRRSGGKDVRVLDKCSTKTKTVYIADCGPCQKANCSGCTPELCSRTCSDCSGRTGAVIDLTKPTFAYFYDPATRGCFSCDVKIQSICP